MFEQPVACVYLFYSERLSILDLQPKLYMHICHRCVATDATNVSFSPKVIYLKTNSIL